MTKDKATLIYDDGEEQLIGKKGERRILENLKQTESIADLKAWFLDLYSAPMHYDAELWIILNEIIDEDTHIRPSKTPKTLFRRIFKKVRCTVGNNAKNRKEMLQAMLVQLIAKWHYELTRETPPAWFTIPPEIAIKEHIN